MCVPLRWRLSDPADMRQGAGRPIGVMPMTKNKTMPPPVVRGQDTRRRKKRIKEIGRITAQLSRFLGDGPPGHRRRILEFGCGDGFQMDHLARFGAVAGMDVSIGRAVREKSTHLVAGDIATAPFTSGTFDIVFSNHVLEHVEDLPQAFSELHRIGGPDCLFAFAVPTSLWLALSIPAQYLNKVRYVIDRIRHSDGRPPHRPPHPPAVRKLRPERGRRRRQGVMDRLIPKGHGTVTGYLRCHDAFKIRSWEHLFRANGFRVLAATPLLIYAPSELPMLPVLPPIGRFGLCSSVLFLMQRDAVAAV